MTVYFDQDVTVRQDARKDAEGVLKAALGVALVPVDPVPIARRLGMNVVDSYLDPEVAGALVKETGRDAVILVNGADSPNRKRFTVAHEIGHYVKRSASPDAFEYVDRRDNLSAAGTDQDEIYANEFAANLLMPEEWVRKYTETTRSPAELAIVFGVSTDAMNFRLKNLGIS